MNQPAILAGVCMLTMTISASLASPVASANAEALKALSKPIRASGVEAELERVVRGTVGAKDRTAQVAQEGRPVSARRAELLKTARGQEMAREARKDIGNALRAHGVSNVAGLRLAAGMSQKELCQATGIPQPHLFRLENGKVMTPELPTLVALSRALGVSLDVLVVAFVADTSTA